MKNVETPAAPGRPRAFDLETALDQALRVFWQKGYEGTSLTDLTEAMGINRPSLYAAFGNKEELFRRALARYSSGPASFFARGLEAPTAREVVEKILAGAVEAHSVPGRPRGCLAVHAALACGDEAGVVRRETMAVRVAAQNSLRERFERARREGDLSRKADPAKLACFYSTILQGMAVQAASGATREDMQNIAELALKAFPA